jgi:hypothetical protein
MLVAAKLLESGKPAECLGNSLKTAFLTFACFSLGL